MMSFVEGFKLTVSGDEMRSHLESRSAWHAERARYYEEQKAQFETAPTREMTEDPVKNLKVAGDRHKQKSEVFAFYAKHVDLEARYRLSDHELQQLEFVSDIRHW
jgi:hypothetical protein